MAIKIAGMHNGLNILDMEAGTGQLFENVLRVNKAGFNIGIDLVFGMLPTTKKRFVLISIILSLFPEMLTDCRFRITPLILFSVVMCWIPSLNMILRLY